MDELVFVPKMEAKWEMRTHIRRRGRDSDKRGGSRKEVGGEHTSKIKADQNEMEVRRVFGIKVVH